MSRLCNARLSLVASVVAGFSAFVLSGCGGGSSASAVSGIGADTKVVATAKIHINTLTGEATVTPIDAAGRALFGGSAVHVGASGSTFDSGELNRYQLSLQLAN